MSLLALSPNQQSAIHWVVDRLKSGAPLVALKGYAGVGKSSLIPHLRRLLQAHGHETVIGTPTNRAAMVVRQKGEQDAATIHSLCLIPHFDEPYTQTKSWLEAYPGTEVAPEDIPALLRETLEDAAGRVLSSHASLITSVTLQSLCDTLRALQRTCQRHGPDKALRTVGMLAEEHFAGFGPRGPQPAILLIDEASMVCAHISTPHDCLVGGSVTMFRVQKRLCMTCIYRPESPLSLAKLEGDIADPRMEGFFSGYRACHHGDGTVCCAGFWTRHKDDFDLGQLAQRLKAVEFVEMDTLSKEGTCL